MNRSPARRLVVHCWSTKLFPYAVSLNMNSAGSMGKGTRLWISQQRQVTQRLVGLPVEPALFTLSTAGYGKGYGDQYWTTCLCVIDPFITNISLQVTVLSCYPSHYRSPQRERATIKLWKSCGWLSIHFVHKLSLFCNFVKENWPCNRKSRKKTNFMYKTYEELSTTCHHFDYIAFWWCLDFKQLYLPYSLPNFVQTFTDLFNEGN